MSKTLHEVLVDYIAENPPETQENVKDQQLSLLGACIAYSKFFGSVGGCMTDEEFHNFTFPLASGIVWLINSENEQAEDELREGLTDIVGGVGRYLTDKISKNQVDIDLVIAAFLGVVATLAAAKTTDNSELAHKRADFYFDRILDAINAQATFYDRELGEQN